MKRIAVIAVLLVFLVNTMGYFVVFKCNQYLAKKEMFAQIRDGNFHADVVLVKIFRTNKDVHFLRNDKNEFTYYGKLYDVISERTSGDTTLFYCLHDTKEESLLAGFTRCILRSGPSGTSPNSNPLQALLHNLITQALVQNSSCPLQGQGTAFIFPVSSETIIPVYLVHFAPPPELA